MFDLDERRLEEKFLIYDLKEIECTRLEIPLAQEFAISGGSIQIFKPILIDIHDNQGNHGLGIIDNFSTSIYDGNGTNTSWIELTGDYIDRLKSWLRIRDELSIFQIHGLLRTIRDPNNFLLSALEMAFWDLIGKREKISGMDMIWEVFSQYLNKMLKNDDSAEFDGQKLQNAMLSERKDRIESGLPSKRSIGLKKTYSDYLHVIDEVLDKKMDSVKIKITDQPFYAHSLVKYVREHYPELQIDTDANASFVPKRDIYGNSDVSNISKSYKLMEPYKIRMHEQPSIFYDDHLEIMKKIQSNTVIPICPDESIHSCHNFIQWVRNIAKNSQIKDNYVNIKLHRTGGILNCIWILAYTKYYNLLHDNKIIPWAGYMPDQELSSNVALSLFTLPVQTSNTDVTDHDYWFLKSIFNQELKTEDGMVKPIIGDGFGLSIDENKIEKAVLKKKTYNIS